MEATLAPPRRELIDEVHGALRRSPYVSGHEMTVEASEGVVRLSGAVRSFFHKQMAQELKAWVKKLADAASSEQVLDQGKSSCCYSNSEKHWTIDPQGLAWFRMQDVPYHGRSLSVVYDEDGRHYRGGAGLRVYVDGALAASRATLGKLVVPVAAKANPVIERPLAQSISLVRADYPKPSASSGTDPERLHQGIDGRVWFMPELPNGWDSTGTTQDEWFAVDFGKPVTLGRAEVSFFAGGAFAMPDSYRLEYRANGAWRPLDTRGAAPRANATDALTWQPIRTDAIRLAIRKPMGKQVRLAEMKLF